jgi:hypothetical protein
MNSEEQAFIRAFIVPEKRERYSVLLASKKRRNKALESLYHTLEVIPELSTPVHNRDRDVETIENLLRQKGSGDTCYLISCESDIDGREMPLRQALEQVLAGYCIPSVLCCIPGRLAYYQGELTQTILEK